MFATFLVSFRLCPEGRGDYKRASHNRMSGLLSRTCGNDSGRCQNFLYDVKDQTFTHEISGFAKAHYKKGWPIFTEKVQGVEN